MAAEQPTAAAAAAAVPAAAVLPPGAIPVYRDDSSHNNPTVVYYRTPKASRDIKHARLKSDYYSKSSYLLAAVAFVFRLVTLILAFLSAAVLLGDVLIVFIWVELLVIVLIWYKYYAGLWLAFVASSASLLAKFLYLAGYWWFYYHVIDVEWFWPTVVLLAVYCIVTLLLVMSVANVLHAKILQCRMYNDLRVLGTRLAPVGVATAYSSSAAATASSSSSSAHYRQE